jgi:DNA polymerase-3 subunit beta
LEEGSTTLPARKFYQLIKELTASNVEVLTNGSDIAEIVADSSRFKLNGMSKNEYPILPDLSTGFIFETEQKNLKEMFFRTSFAVSREDSRYVLNGVLLRIANGKASFVGTDGKRLAKMQMAINVDPGMTGEYVIPLKAVDEILKLLGDTTDMVKVFAKDNKIAIQSSDTTFISKLLNGDYPDVERVIPNKTDISISLHREELIQLLRQIALFIAEVSHSVRFTFTNGELYLTANSMQIGEGKVSMPVNYNGDQLDIAFNPSYFLDILRHSKDETVTLSIIDSFNPGLITDSSGGLFVIMPMRLNEV